jgi:translation initiation factor IF-2
MSDIDETDGDDQSGDKKPLSLKRPGRLELRKTVDAGQVRQSFSHGRSKAVTVEVKRKRTFKPGQGEGMTEVKAATPPP